MPMDRAKYASDWDAISRRIRDRAGQKCEWCHAPNGAEIVRSSVTPMHYMLYDEEHDWYTVNGQSVRLSEIPEEFAHLKGIRVVLTVAHLNHDTTDNRDENLAALCQRCHLKYDAVHHARNARRTRLAKQQDQKRSDGQEVLL